jgi:hypothetical protein
LMSTVEILWSICAHDLPDVIRTLEDETGI